MLESPRNVTVTVLDPAGRDDVVRVAFPPLNCALPSVVLPAVNVTGPVGTTVADVIFTEKVTLWPSDDGFGADVMAAVLEVGRTV